MEDGRAHTQQAQKGELVGLIWIEWLRDNALGSLPAVTHRGAAESAEVDRRVSDIDRRASDISRVRGGGYTRAAESGGGVRLRLNAEVKEWTDLRGETSAMEMRGFTLREVVNESKVGGKRSQCVN